MKDTWKEKQKEKKRKTQQTQKIEGQLKNSEAFFLQKMEQQSREKKFSNEKKNKKEMTKTNFFWKAGETDIF